MLPLKCPRCQMLMKWPDERAGSEGVCPRCSERFEVPRSEDPFASTSFAESSNPYHSPQFAPSTRVQSSNSLGVAGFILSLIGIVLCGPLTLVGLILSLFALGRQPRGFAIAGLIIGVLGVAFMLLSFAFFFLMQNREFERLFRDFF